MDRITPEQVIEAYRKIDYSPARESWLNEERKSCCGLTAVALANGLTPPKDGFLSGGIVAEHLGLSYSGYTVAFADGFDGLSKDEFHDPAGYEDGQAAWEAVKREFI